MHSVSVSFLTEILYLAVDLIKCKLAIMWPGRFRGAPNNQQPCNEIQFDMFLKNPIGFT